MTILSIFSLTLAMLVFTATPGPGVFATVSRSLASGFRPVLPLIAGIVIGDLIYLLFAIFGLSMIAQALGKLFIMVRIAGGVYLFWLGINMWLKKTDMKETGAPHNAAWQSNTITGLLITLSNPKVILFYCGFLPTFIDLSRRSVGDVLVLVVVVTVVLGSVMLVYAALACRARTLFTSPPALKRMHRTAGTVMMAAGVAVAVKS